MSRKAKPTKFIRLRIDIPLIVVHPVDSITFGGDKAQLEKLLLVITKVCAEFDPHIVGYGRGAHWNVSLDHRDRVSSPVDLQTGE